MARYCIVAPVHLLERLRDYDELGGYHLLLAHDVVKHPKRYADIFLNLPSNDRFVIMDNSVVELGTAVDFGMVAEATAIAKPNCVVLPDAYLNCDKTIEQCRAALNDEWYEKLKTDLLMIPQGLNMWQFAKCAEQFAEDPRIKYWGVPRNMVEQVGTRRDAITLVNALNKHRIIHMFGFSDNHIDDVICAQNPQVYSIDSAVPVRCQGRLSLTTKMPRRGDWWETSEFSQEMIMNVNIARQWFRYRATVR